MAGRHAYLLFHQNHCVFPGRSGLHRAAKLWASQAQSWELGSKGFGQELSRGEQRVVTPSPTPSSGYLGMNSGYDPFWGADPEHMQFSGDLYPNHA